MSAVQSTTFSSDESDAPTRAIEAAIDALGARHGAVSLIVGAPGMGKSRLLDHARAYARARGIETLRAQGDPAEREMPLGVHRALTDPANQRLDPQRREQLFATINAIEPLIFADPGLTPNFPHTPPEDYVPKPTILHALDVMLRALSEQPLLMCIDDGQWVDDATLRWVAYIANRIDRFPVLILLATRPVVERDDTLTTLLAHPTLPRLQLERRPDPDGVTGGIPLVAHAVASGDVGAIDRFVAALLADVGADAAALVQALALLGASESRWALDVAGLTPATAAVALNRLRAAGIVDAHGSLVSSAVNDAIIRAIPADERDPMRARCAATLADHGASLTDVAEQLLPIEHHLDATQIDWLRLAADAAAKDAQLADRSRYLRRLDREPLSGDLRVEVRLQLACTLAADGDADADDAFARALEAAPDATARATVQLAKAQTWIDQARGEPLHLIDQLFETARTDPSVDSSTLMRAEALRGTLVVQPRLVAEVASRVATVSDTIKPLAAVERELLCVAAYGALASGDGARARLQSARALDDPAAMPSIGAAALEMGIVAAAQSGQVALATRAADASVIAARHSEDRLALATALAQRVVAGLAAGRLAEAVQDARASLDGLAPNAVAVRGGTAARAAIALVAQGHVDEAERLLDAHPRDPDAEIAPLLQLDLALALLRMEQGRPQEAIALLNPLVALETPAFTVPVAATLSRALLAAGETAAAEQLASENLERVRAAECGPTALSVALRTHGLAAKGHTRLSLLSDAVAQARRGEAPLELARGLLDLGMALRRAGRRADARSSLAEAITIAQQLGAAPLAELAAAELAATGSRVLRDGVLARQRLTPSEERIARLAADGLSNPQIASSQYLTRKTVEMHLTSAYGKLGITSRQQLAEALDAVQDPEDEAP